VFSILRILEGALSSRVTHWGMKRMRNVIVGTVLVLFVSSLAWASFGYWVVSGYEPNKRRIAGPFVEVLVCDRYAARIQREMNLPAVRCEFLVD